MPAKIPLVRVKCAYCGVFKMIHTWQIRQGHGKYCSKRCGYDSHITKPIKICLTCKKEFKVKKSREYTAKYCSIKCYDKNGVNNAFFNKRHTLGNRIKMSAIKQEIEEKDWKVFTSREKRRVMGTAPYRRFREAVLERDNYKCVWCGATENLDVDHIKPYAYFPDLRLTVSNGRVLCRPCHETTPTFRNPKGKNQYVTNPDA